MNKKRSIYVAGPMTGLPKLNYPKFRRVAERLRTKGWKVVSPVEIGESMGLPEPGDPGAEPDGALLQHVIDAELRALRDCDAIYVMRGWERSAGTLKELVVAIAYGLEIVLEKGGAR